MALSMPIPPWLQTRPVEFATAHEAGLRSGLEAAHIWANANAERARLEQAAKRADMEAQLERERLQEKSIYEAQKLAADVAYNKTALELQKSRIEQTQANAAQAAQKFALTHALATRRLALSQAMQEGRLAISKRREAETERRNRAIEAKPKGTDMDAALAQYAKDSRASKESKGGALDWIKGIFSKGPVAPATAPAPAAGKAPYEEGQYVTHKKDGKTYQIRNGLPVLVDDQGGGEEEPGPPTDREGDEE